MSEGTLHLLAYDIADHGRLGRVAGIAERYGVRVQYSVFVLRLTPPAREALMTELSRAINSREDDVRIYPLPSRPTWELHGRAMWPEGIVVSGIWPEAPTEDCQHEQNAGAAESAAERNENGEEDT